MNKIFKNSHNEFSQHFYGSSFLKIFIFIKISMIGNLSIGEILNLVLYWWFANLEINISKIFQNVLLLLLLL